MNESNSDGLSASIVSLLKGVVAREDNEARWQTLMHVEPRVRDYVAVLGLELILVEDEGYAFLRQRPADSDDPLPRLVSRHQLSYPVSLLLALLRRRLAEHDASGGDPRLIVDIAEMIGAVQVFLPEGNNEARITDQITTHLRKISDLGFIRFLTSDSQKFEVKRILKQFVDAEWLLELEARMAGYQKDQEQSAEV